jgi:mono/diheme cytochrome c family protein
MTKKSFMNMLTSFRPFFSGKKIGAALSLSFLLAACGDTPSNGSGATGGTLDGASVFRKYCVNCHGANGKLGLSGAKDLSVSALSLEDRVALITNGRGLMAAYRDILSEAEIKAVAEYTLQLRQPQ